MKTPKKLTRRQAWLKIQGWFQELATTGRDDRNTHSGLCWSVSCLHDAEEITTEVLLEMQKDICSVKPAGSTKAWYWPTSSIFDNDNKAVKGAKSRVRAINKILKNI